MRRTLLALVLLAGCSRPYLRWTQREPLSARRGKLAVVVEDATGTTSLGRVFGFGGVPRALLLDEGEAKDRLTQLTREAAITAGLGLAAKGETADARVLVRLEALRCEGLHRTATAELRVTWAILGPDGVPRTDAMVWGGKGTGPGCERALGDALDQLLDELAAKLVDGPVREAVLTAG